MTVRVHSTRARFYARWTMYVGGIEFCPRMNIEICCMGDDVVEHLLVKKYDLFRTVSRYVLFELLLSKFEVLREKGRPVLKGINCKPY